MRLSRQQEKESARANYDGYPGDLWYAMSRLHAAHPEPVGRSVPFERPSALLSFMEPDDIVLAARVGLSGTETMGHLHDLIDTVTRGLSGGSRIGESALVPDIVLEVMAGGRNWRCTPATSQASPSCCGTPLAPSVPAAHQGAAGASTARGPGMPARCGSGRGQSTSTSRSSRTARSRWCSAMPPSTTV